MTTPQAVRQPLSHHKVFESDQVDQIRDKMNSLYNGSAIRFGPPEGERRLAHAMYVAPLGSIMLTSFSWPLGVNAEAPCLEDTFDFCAPCSSSGNIRVGHEEIDYGPSCGVVLSPNLPMRIRLGKGNVNLNANVRRALLEDQLRAITGDEVSQPLEFEPALRLRRQSVAGVWRFVEFVAREIDQDETVLSNSIVCERFCEAIVTQLLYAQPHNYSHLLHREVYAAEPRYVREVEEYLEAHCDQPQSARELAAVAKVSMSALYAAFRRHRGYTPSEFLKTVRLRRVRDALLAASPDATVRQIASRWGFTHLGRFSQVYRRRYGESPVETLRR